MTEENICIRPDSITKITRGEKAVKIECIPTHSEKAELTGYEIYDNWTLTKHGTLPLTKDKKAVEEDFCNNKPDFDKEIETKPFFQIHYGAPKEKREFKVYPVYRWKEAIFNPYFVGWNEGYIPDCKK